MDGATAYPLAWPAHKPRTPVQERKGGAFRSRCEEVHYRSSVPVQMTDARERIADSLDRMGARYPVLSTNVELRLDGQPRANAPQPTDPGVAVYFHLRGKPIALACDRYLTVAANMAAIAAHIDATRAIERHGVGTIEQAFAGFVALPAPGRQPWRAILGFGPGVAVTRVMVRTRWIDLARQHHSDAGGTGSRMAEINAARDDALTEVG